MRMNSLLSILIGSLSIASHAFPIGAGKSASSINCNQNGYEKSFSEMVQKVAIIGDMSIKSFDKSYAEYGITPEEARQIHNASGELKCTAEGQTAASNAWLIGSTQEITVNLHMFKDKEDKPYPSDILKGCQFVSYAYPDKSFELDFEKTPADNFLNRLNLPYNSREDWVKIRLKNPVKKVKSLEPDFSEAPINKNDELIMVSRRPSSMSPYQASNQLTLQSCSAQKVAPSNFQSTRLYMDCDNFEGMSGALMFKRRADGVLVPKAFHVGGQGKLGDGKPWNDLTNTAVAVVFDKGFLALYGPNLTGGKSAGTTVPQTN